MALLKVALLHSLSCLRDILIKLHQILLASPIKFYMIDMLLINNLKKFSKIFFLCTVRVKIYMETLTLRFLTSVYFSKVALTVWGGKI